MKWINYIYRIAKKYPFPSFFFLYFISTVTFGSIFFLFFSNNYKDKFLKKEFKDQWKPIDQPDTDYGWFGLLMVLVICVISYSNIYLYLNGVPRFGKVLSSRHIHHVQKLDRGSMIIDNYMVTVDGFPYEIYSLQPVKKGTTFRYLTSGHRYPKWLESSDAKSFPEGMPRWKAVFANAQWAPFVAIGFVLSLIIALSFMLQFMFRMLICFIKSRMEKDKLLEQIGNLIVGSINFFTIFELSIVFIKSIYNDINSRYVGGVIIFAILALMRCLPFFESLLLFLLKVTFEESKNLLIRVSRLLFKLGASYSFFMLMTTALWNRNQSLWGLTLEWIKQIMGG